MPNLKNEGFWGFNGQYLCLRETRAGSNRPVLPPEGSLDPNLQNVPAITPQQGKGFPRTVGFLSRNDSVRHSDPRPE